MKNLKRFTLSLALIFSTAIHAQQYAGNWAGKLSFQNTSLNIVFHIQKTNNVYSATMDSPDQKAFGLKVKAVTATAEKIILDMSDMGITFEGKLISDSLKGSFSQAGQAFPLALGRIKDKDAYAGPKRPQEPKPKYNYRAEEVVFTNEKANIKLSGTLTLPKGKGPFPAVILISGSGPQNRDEEILNHKPFFVIADYLTQKGIAVLRYDDRGVAKSEGDFGTSTSADFADDAQAAVEFLKKHKLINAAKIGVIGHSEGGMIAPMLASKDKQIAFIVLLAGPGIPIDELMLKQTALGVQASGIPEEGALKIQEVNKKCYEIVKNQPDVEKARTALNELFLEEGIASDDAESLLEQTLSPWFRYFISYDPQPVLENVKCPVLAINGDNDQQVTSKENLAGIKKSLEKGGNQKFEIHEVKDKNHLFQTSKTGLISEYGEIEETFSPEVMKIMATWILKLK